MWNNNGCMHIAPDQGVRCMQNSIRLQATYFRAPRGSSTHFLLARVLQSPCTLAGGGANGKLMYMLSFPPPVSSAVCMWRIIQRCIQSSHLTICSMILPHIRHYHASQLEHGVLLGVLHCQLLVCAFCCLLPLSLPSHVIFWAPK